jgi:hypothetical protein
MNPNRQTVPLRVADVSTFAKQLRQLLIEASEPPTHLSLLNMLARSAGHRNFQAFRRAALEVPPTAQSTDSQPPLDPASSLVAPKTDASGSPLSRTVARALTHFDIGGRLTRFPQQLSVRDLTLWGLWCRFPTNRDLDEASVNDIIERFHRFGDIATLRRELVNTKLLWRTRDGRVYRRVAVTPEGEAATFLKLLASLATPKQPKL